MIQFEETRKRHSRIEIIPMIDVMMFLLVFFVLISINVIPAAGLATVLPSASHAEHLNPDKPVIVTFTRQDHLQVNGEDCQLAELVEKVRRAAQGKGDPQVTLRSDAEASMQQLVDIMDILRQGQIQHVSIATRARAARS